MARIVLVAPEGLPIPPVRGGSVQIYLQALHGALSTASEADVILLCPDSNVAGSDEFDQRLMEDMRMIHVDGSRSAYRTTILELLRGACPDVIQIDNRPDFLPRVKQTCPSARLVLNLHSTTFLGPRHLRPQQAVPTLRLADAIVVNSHYLQRQVEMKFSLRRGKWPFYVIYPGVHAASFADRHRTNEEDVWPVSSPDPVQTDDDAPAAVTRRSNTLQLLFVGRVIEQKGVHVLIDALSILRKRGVPATLMMVGRAPKWQRRYAMQLRKKIRTLPVAWVGFIPPHELAPYYWGADVLVCPSQRGEAFGLVNLEAMAAGLPVVASRQGGIREVVTDDSGVLVTRYRQPVAFANAIESLYRDSARMQSLRLAALERAQAFSWTRTAEAFDVLYQRLLADFTSSNVACSPQKDQGV